MLADYHIHTTMCGHAEGKLEDYILKAKAEGLEEIGISDHIPMYFWPEEERDPTVAMALEELPDYISLIERAQKKFYPFPIRTGIEADFSAEHQSTLRDILEQFPFDYVLGSIHFIGKWGYDNPAYLEEYQNRDIDEIYEQYFGLLEQAATSGLFDIMAHPDLIKKMGFKPRRDIGYIYKRLARVFAEADLCIEVNTAGLRAPVGEIFPAPAFLRECFKAKVPVTLGSDAHQVSQVAAGFREARRLIQETGYKQLTVFCQRKKRSITL